MRFPPLISRIATNFGGLVLTAAAAELFCCAPRYLAAQAWRRTVNMNVSADEVAAATREAWRAFSGLSFLHNVTGVPGLMARSVVRCGAKHGKGDEPNTGWTNSSVCFADDPVGPACCWTW